MMPSFRRINILQRRSHQIFSRARMLAYAKEKKCIQRLWVSTKSSSTTKKKHPSPQPTSNTNNQLFNHNSEFMNNKRFLIGGSQTSLSELAGHLSFVFVTLAFVNTDVLWLRGLATGSISLSIIFQYYRPQPLWIPIRWNALLLAINTIMMSNMVIERYQANHMSSNLQLIYHESHFEQRGFNRIEFHKLFRMGRQAKYSKNEFLTLHGERNHRLYFIVDGEIIILKDELKLATVPRNHFIGELAFLDFTLQNGDDEDSGDDGQHVVTPSRLASADAMVHDEKGVIVWVWEYDELRAFLAKERQISNALSAYINHELRSKLVQTGIAMSDLDHAGYVMRELMS